MDPDSLPHRSPLPRRIHSTASSMSDAGGFSLLVSLIDPALLRLAHRRGRSETSRGQLSARWLSEHVRPRLRPRLSTPASAATARPPQSQDRGRIAQMLRACDRSAAQIRVRVLHNGRSERHFSGGGAFRANESLPWQPHGRIQEPSPEDQPSRSTYEPHAASFSLPGRTN